MACPLERGVARASSAAGGIFDVFEASTSAPGQTFAAASGPNPVSSIRARLTDKSLLESGQALIILTVPAQVVKLTPAAPPMSKMVLWGGGGFIPSRQRAVRRCASPVRAVPATTNDVAKDLRKSVLCDSCIVFFLSGARPAGRALHAATPLDGAIAGDSHPRSCGRAALRESSSGDRRTDPRRTPAGPLVSKILAKYCPICAHPTPKQLRTRTSAG
mgnify:CR=1 FL=1